MPKKPVVRDSHPPSHARAHRRSRRTPLKSPAGGSRRIRSVGKLTLPELFPQQTNKEFSRKVEQHRLSCIQELQAAYVRGGLVLYLGAGVSKSVGLPTWLELIRSLTVSMMSEKLSSQIATRAKWTRPEAWSAYAEFQSQIAKSAEYDKPVLMMARAIKDQLAEMLPNYVAYTLYMSHPGIREHMRPAIYGDPSDNARKLPTSELLDAVVALARAQRNVGGVKAVVNYNFDDLLEERLLEEKVRCVLVRSGADRQPPRMLPCYHVHGVLPMKAFWSASSAGRSMGDNTIGNFVFSEDEYHTEYSDAYRWSNMTQMGLLGQNTGLFVGLSMEDANIRRLIDVTHRQYPDNWHYAILKRRQPLVASGTSDESILRNLFEQVETDSFEKIGVRVIWANEFAEIPGLLNQIHDVDAALQPGEHDSVAASRDESGGGRAGAGEAPREG